ncbi:MAG TPA: peptide deformylase [Thermoanaerobaculia bacterium]|nr:peptide deformylase [Thermoanaerobaculia bacterium]
MPKLDIVRLGHPALRTPAHSVPEAEIGSDEIQRLVDDLVETMREVGSLGLSAPQVGIGSQLFVYEIRDEAAVPSEPVALRVVINPMIVAVPGRLVYDWEGCSSSLDLRGLVPRHPSVRVRGLDRQGEALDYTAGGLEARIIQHEYDHLNGMVFLDRMRDLRSLAFSEEWARYLCAEGEEMDYSAVG